MRPLFVMSVGILLLLIIPATASAAILGEDNATMGNESNMTTMPDNVTGNQTGMMEENQTGNMTVVEVIDQNGNLTILAQAINATNLTEPLSTGGPYTVFAPTDTAFEALGNETIGQLLNNTDQLTAILQYHVVEGNYTAEELMEMVQPNMTTAANQTMENVTGNQTMENVTDNQTMENVTGNQTMENVTGNQTNVTGQQAAVMLQTLLGPNVTVSQNQTTDELMINNATIVVTDLNASNGVVHIIDAVLTPPENVTMQANQTGMSIVGVIGANDNLSTLATGIQTANLTETLDTGGPYTVFAPTNEAFGAMTPEDLSGLLNNPDQLATILQYHVVEGEYTAEELVSMATGGNATNATNATTTGSTTLQTLLGENLTVTVSEEEVTVGNATVEMANLDANNGIVHTIDMVLVPENVTLGATTANQTMGNVTGNVTTANQTMGNVTENVTMENMTTANTTAGNQTI
ncbi:fasciclin domain-containing protein [Methanoculleus taiwanensis]|uniref:fasciclin domain-containing protein n=1 Tax=Methanoculleus taiwanensis TaxID=1550565 RepID=UPI0013E8DBA7|nr:fasciclin domain-containing protein [Methanoculleus taiwanensis]